MTDNATDDGDISYALVCLKTGALLEGLDPGAPSARLLDLAAAAPELFQVSGSSELAALFASLGSERERASFQEIVFASAESAHVLQRLVRRPDVALVAVSVDANTLGLMLSGVRTRMQKLEASGRATDLEPRGAA